MTSLIEQIKAGRLWQFPGGIHPPGQKHPAADAELRHIPLAAQLIVPLKQHIGLAAALLVEPGQHVLKGQPLTKTDGLQLPVHAPTSGTVVSIENRPTAHPSGLAEPSLVLEPDGEDRWAALAAPVTQVGLHKQQALQQIAACGIAGLGGAGFPTATKLDGGTRVELLIINAAECEPYICCDDALMRQRAESVVRGIELLRQLVEPKLVVLAIEDDKPLAIEAMQRACAATEILVKPIPTKYPSGGERQLIQIITGREVPSGGLPKDIGVLVQNVGTAYAVARALDHGEPLIERLVTVSGKGIRQPGNYWVPIGTPVNHLLQAAGLDRNIAKRVIMGGPMMGFALPHGDLPIIKTSNCILAPAADELTEPSAEQPCIRCGQCAQACPASLLPQQLFWHARAQAYEPLQAHRIGDCIECGICAYVCPSAIPLVHYYRKAKAELRQLAAEKQQAERAKARFEAKQARLEAEKQERERKHQQAAQARMQAMAARSEQDNGNDKDLVAAALARAKAKKAAQQTPVSEPDGTHAQPDNSAVIAERERRKAQRAAKAAEQTTPELDPKKAAVAAAIARAKAKKAQQQAGESPAPTPAPSADDQRKAAVAAAVARAKAKQRANQAEAQADSATADTTTAAADETLAAKKKAAVEAAIARAKARRAAQQQKNED